MIEYKQRYHYCESIFNATIMLSRFFAYKQDFSCIILYVVVMILSS